MILLHWFLIYIIFSYTDPHTSIKVSSCLCYIFDIMFYYRYSISLKKSFFFFNNLNRGGNDIYNLDYFHSIFFSYKYNDNIHFCNYQLLSHHLKLLSFGVFYNTAISDKIRIMIKILNVRFDIEHAQLIVNQSRQYDKTLVYFRRKSIREIQTEWTIIWRRFRGSENAAKSIMRIQMLLL